MSVKWKRRAEYVTSVLEANDGALWRSLLELEPGHLQEMGVSTPAEAVILFASADPNEHRKPYLGWLVSTYIRGGYLLEDLGKARDTLQLFDQLKHRLPADDRDINRYQALGDVWAAIDPLLPKDDEADWSPSKRAEERELKRQVMAETEILLARDDGFTMAIPLTERAAKWWGRGTRWCTAADRNNMFHNYHSASPLVVMRWPDGRKIQAWMTPKNTQIMDESDVKPEASFYLERRNEMEPVFSKLAELNMITRKMLYSIPPPFFTEEIILKIAQSDLTYISKIPNKCLKTDIVERIIDENIPCFKSLPRSMISRDLLLSYATENGGWINKIPGEFITPDLIKIALKQDPTLHILYRIPKSKRTPEITMAALEATGQTVRQIPQCMITPEILLLAAKTYHAALKYAAPEILTPEIVLEIVGYNGIAMEWVPEHLKTPEVCLAAVKTHPLAIIQIPKHILTTEMIITALQKSRRTSVLRYVPESMMTREVLLTAIRNDPHGHVSKQIPKDLVTPEIALELAKHEAYGSILYLDHKFLTPEVVETAIERAPFLLPRLPVGCLTEKAIKTSISANPSIKHQIPQELVTPEIFEHWAAAQRDSLLAENKMHEARQAQYAKTSPEWPKMLGAWQSIADTISSVQLSKEIRRQEKPAFTNHPGAHLGLMPL